MCKNVPLIKKEQKSTFIDLFTNDNKNKVKKKCE